MVEQIDFSFEVEPETVGMSRPGVQKIVSVFEQQFVDQLNIGAQLVLLRRGQVVLDRVIGVCRLGTTQMVRRGTPFLLFSCGKALTAVCILKLIEAGKLELDAPVADYWPEFGTKGKEATTIAHALAHQAGIPGRGLYPQIPRWWYWDSVVNNVAGLTAEFEPGTKTAYHLVNNGFILGELVRRVTNTMIDEYMQKEIFKPLDMVNSYLGIPAQELDRAAEVYWAAADQRNTVLLFRYARQALLPAATLNASARDLAVFYQMLLNGGTYNGHQILKPETVGLATAVYSDGMDETFQEPTRWGLGFWVGGAPLQEGQRHGLGMGRWSTLNTFGHGGQRSSIGWADKEDELVLAFTTNQLLSEQQAGARIQALADATWESLVEYRNPRLGK